MVINLFLSRIKFDKLQLIKYNIYMNENLSQEISEFKIFGMSMESLSIGYGLFLIIWGIIMIFIYNYTVKNRINFPTNIY